MKLYKNKLFLLVIVILLSAGKCQREGDDCHLFIKVENNSNASILFTTIGLHSDTVNCSQLLKSEIPAFSSFDYYPYNSCIEYSLSSTIHLIPMSFIDPSNYSETYPCDSLENYNTILKHVTLTFNDLKASDFTISYP